MLALAAALLTTGAQASNQPERTPIYAAVVHAIAREGGGRICLVRELGVGDMRRRQRLVARLAVHRRDDPAFVPIHRMVRDWRPRPGDAPAAEGAALDALGGTVSDSCPVESMIRLSRALVRGDHAFVQAVFGWSCGLSGSDFALRRRGGRWTVVSQQNAFSVSPAACLAPSPLPSGPGRYLVLGD